MAKLRLGGGKARLFGPWRLGQQFGTILRDIVGPGRPSMACDIMLLGNPL